jgi:purine-binding chemotaxis protein CheW
MSHKEGMFMEVLLFKLSDETFALPLQYVEAIEHISQLTVVPKTKPYIDGLVNIRGSIIPIVDLAKLLKLNAFTLKDKLVLIRYKDQPIALVVSDVDDVINIEDNEIEIINSKHERFSVLNYNNMIVTYISEEILSRI